MKIPQSIGLIPDGNRRWAKKQKLSTAQGHLTGYKNIENFCNWCFQKKIKHVFVYAFSYENWQRSATEVDFLMKLFARAIKNYVQQVHQKNYQFKLIGRRDKFSSKLINQIETAEQLTATNTAGSLNICVSYGGHQELVDAVKKIITQKIPVQEVNEELIAKNLYNPNIPDLDLIIRTGNNSRLSNFLPWQSAYAELFFSQSLWPNFSAQEFDEILDKFSKCQRNFGK